MGGTPFEGLALWWKMGEEQERTRVTGDSVRDHLFTTAVSRGVRYPPMRHGQWEMRKGEPCSAAKRQSNLEENCGPTTRHSTPTFPSIASRFGGHWKEAGRLDDVGRALLRHPRVWTWWSVDMMEFSPGGDAARSQIARSCGGFEGDVSSSDRCSPRPGVD